MGDVAGINDLIEAWRVRINSDAPFAVSNEDKENIKQIFPNRKFKSGCKDCYKDVIIELVTQGLPKEPTVYEVTDAANFSLCEKAFPLGFAIFIGNDKKRFSIENSEGKTPEKFEGDVFLSTSEVAKAFFKENVGFHKYLIPIQ